MRKNKKKKNNLDSDLRKTLKKERVSKIKFNEFKSSLGILFITCTFFDEDRKPSARGLSICSLADTFIRKEGKKKAFNRAVKAIVTKMNSNEVIERDNIKRYVRRSVDNSTQLQSLNQYIRRQRYVDYKGKKKFEFSIDSSAPLRIAKQKYSFRYKSEYKPVFWDYTKANIPGIEVT